LKGIRSLNKDKTGIERKARCHGLLIFRHSGGSAVSIACGIKVGQEYLRHQDYKTTANIYWHLDDAALRQATELLAGQFVGALSYDRISSVNGGTTKNGATGPLVAPSFCEVVAGAGFEPATFGL